MGTSQSNPGPRPSSPLVPPWADDEPGKPLPKPEPNRFSSFRRLFGSFATSGDRADLRRALGGYARKVTGGGSVAVRRMGSITQAGGNLFALLTGRDILPTRGETTITLQELSGQPCELAIAAISQSLATRDGDGEKIRSAINHALAEALEGVESFDPNQISDDIVVNTMISYLSETIFLQVVMDGGKAWNKAQTPQQSLRAESALRELIKVLVDKHLASRLDGHVRTLGRTEMNRLQQQVIAEVWREWEGY